MLHLSLPYEFLRCRYILDTLLLFANAKEPITIPFYSGDEAVQRFYDIVRFKTQAKDVLDHAAYIVDIEGMIQKLNQYVRNNPYLSSSMELTGLGKSADMAKSCLQDIPMYQSLMTKAFRKNYLESCISYLPQNDLIKILDARILKATDLKRLKPTGSKRYNDNMAYLKDVTGYNLSEQTFYTPLKGVSFPDKDTGTPRQQTIQELSTQLHSSDAKEGISLTAKQKKVTIQETQKEEDTIEIYWGNRSIGYLPKEVISQIQTTYTNPQIDVCLERITPPSNSSRYYGVEIKVHILAEKVQKAEKETEEVSR